MMSRREFIGSAAAVALVPPLPNGGDRMPDTLRNTREQAGPLCRGDVLELGIGAGYTMRSVLGCSSVRTYTGIEVDRRIVRDRSGEIPWRMKDSARVVETDAIEYLGGCESFDVVVWDIHPLLDADGNERNGLLTDRADLRDVLLSRVRPGGRLIFWTFGPRDPTMRCVSSTLVALDNMTTSTMYLMEKR